MYDPLNYEQQAKEQGVQLNQQYKDYLLALRAVALTFEGRQVLCQLLERLGTFEQSWHEKNAHMFRSVVLKDVGQEILDDLALTADDIHDDIQRAMRMKRKLVIMP